MYRQSRSQLDYLEPIWYEGRELTIASDLGLDVLRWFSHHLSVCSKTVVSNSRSWTGFADNINTHFYRVRFELAVIHFFVQKCLSLGGVVVVNAEIFEFQLPCADKRARAPLRPNVPIVGGALPC